MKKELLTIIKTYYDFNFIEDIKRIKKGLSSYFGIKYK